MTAATTPTSHASWSLQLPAFAVSADEVVSGFNETAEIALKHACDIGLDLTAFCDRLTGGNPADIEALQSLFRDPDVRQALICAGGKRWLASLLPIENGRLLTLHLYGVADQAAVAEDEECLIETSRSRFLTTMSHELRTPLNSIAGFAEMIAMRAFGSDSSRYEEYGRYIVEATGKTLEAVDALITLAALESNGVRIHHETIDAGAALAQAIATVRQLNPKAQISVSLPDTRIFLRADADLLHQALTSVASELARNVTGDKTIEASIQPRGNGTSFVFSGFGPDGAITEALTAYAGAGLWVATTVAEAHGGGLRITKKSSGKRKIKLVFP